MKHEPLSRSNGLLFLFLVGLLAYISVSIAGEATLDERKRLLAYAALFASALFATSLPNALIPDPSLPAHQLMNSSPMELLKAQIRRWRLWLIGLATPIPIIALTDTIAPFDPLGPRLILLVAYLMTVIATGLYSLSVYYSIGPSSQHWQEGQAGSWWNRVVEYNPAFQPSVPRGLLPALTATVQVFGAGIVVVVASMYLERDAGLAHALWPGLFFLVLSVRKVRRLRDVFDRYYYHSNAFYGEVLRSGSFTDGVKETTVYEALYWVPLKWRPHVWASLVQLERAVPVGRFLLIALAFVWILSIRDASPALLSVCLLLIVAGKNLSILSFNRPDLAAPLLVRSMQSPFDWSMTRSFVNLKWTLLFIVCLLPVAWLDPDFSGPAAAGWVLGDFLASFVFAFLITYGWMHRERYAFAR